MRTEEIGNMDKAPNPSGTVKRNLKVEVTVDPCFEGVQRVYHTERGSEGHFRLKQRGCTNTQLLITPIHELFSWTKCFPFCGYTCTYLVGILPFDHSHH